MICPKCGIISYRINVLNNCLLRSQFTASEINFISRYFLFKTEKSCPICKPFGYHAKSGNIADLRKAVHMCIFKMLRNLAVLNEKVSISPGPYFNIFNMSMHYQWR